MGQFDRLGGFIGQAIQMPKVARFISGKRLAEERFTAFTIEPSHFIQTAPGSGRSLQRRLTPFGVGIQVRIRLVEINPMQTDSAADYS